jgi:peptide/nickel transport system substrate-binding protein
VASRSAALDPNAATKLGNEIDARIWQEVHSLTLYQRPQIVASRSNLASFGAFGFASTDSTAIGFTKR